MPVSCHLRNYTNFLIRIICLIRLLSFIMGQKKMSNEEQTTFNMRVGRTLVEQFKKAAKENNRTASQLLRDCMIDYVKEHRQSTLKE